MCLCVGLIVTTYIPFFFLTILIIFSFLYIFFYGKVLAAFIKRSFSFFRQNRIFTVFCIFFLLSSCIPALVFYKESKSGEFVLPNRHAGADSASAVAVGLDNVASGDIINHGYFDRIFDDHAHLDMGDIYMPYVFFLILLSTALARSNKLIFFLLFNILSLSLITITSAAGVHRFLYEHIIIFKFIRNIYYFFWLAMLPMVILISVAAFKSLLAAISSSSNKIFWLFNIAACHLAFILFLCGRHGVFLGAWAAVSLSMIYFLVYFYCDKKISYPAGFVLLLLAVFVQSAQVYAHLDNKLFQLQRLEAINAQAHQNYTKPRLDLYYSSAWFSALVEFLDPQVLEDYSKHRFIFYDNAIPYSDSPEFFKTLQAAMGTDANIAFLSRSESVPGDWRRDENAGLHAELDPLSTGELSVLPADVNTVKLRAHLDKSRFLVINDNYNSGWQAYINGQKARLLRTNFSFKGLWVPSGDSSIVLHFSNTRRYLLHFALIILFAGVFIYLLMLLRRLPKGTYAQE